MGTEFIIIHDHFTGTKDWPQNTHKKKSGFRTFNTVLNDHDNSISFFRHLIFSIQVDFFMTTVKHAHLKHNLFPEIQLNPQNYTSPEQRDRGKGSKWSRYHLLFC